MCASKTNSSIQGNRKEKEEEKEKEEVKACAWNEEEWDNKEKNTSKNKELIERYGASTASMIEKDGQHKL